MTRWSAITRHPAAAAPALAYGSRSTATAGKTSARSSHRGRGATYFAPALGCVLAVCDFSASSVFASGPSVKQLTMPWLSLRRMGFGTRAVGFGRARGGGRARPLLACTTTRAGRDLAGSGRFAVEWTEPAVLEVLRAASGCARSKHWEGDGHEPTEHRLAPTQLPSAPGLRAGAWPSTGRNE